MENKAGAPCVFYASKGKMGMVDSPARVGQGRPGREQWIVKTSFYNLAEDGEVGMLYLLIVNLCSL